MKEFSPRVTIKLEAFKTSAESEQNEKLPDC